MAKKKDKKWIQKASASIKKRGTEGVCTGDKFGGPSCPPGSRRYNLAKVFKGMARKKKKAATGAMIKAKTSTFAETHASNWAKRRAASTTAMTLPANIARVTNSGSYLAVEPALTLAVVMSKYVLVTDVTVTVATSLTKDTPSEPTCLEQVPCTL